MDRSVSGFSDSKTSVAQWIEQRSPKECINPRVTLMMFVLTAQAPLRNLLGPRFQ